MFQPASKNGLHHSHSVQCIYLRMYVHLLMHCSHFAKRAMHSSKVKTVLNQMSIAVNVASSADPAAGVICDLGFRV
jgi:hypothetical protein